MCLLFRLWLPSAGARSLVRFTMTGLAAKKRSEAPSASLEIQPRGVMILEATGRMALICYARQSRVAPWTHLATDTRSKTGTWGTHELSG